ncbi:MAG: hypothetical protein ACKVOH_03995 [Chlamydiales bacterium]
MSELSTSTHSAILMNFMFMCALNAYEKHPFYVSGGVTLLGVTLLVLGILGLSKLPALKSISHKGWGAAIGIGVPLWVGGFALLGIYLKKLSDITP